MTTRVGAVQGTLDADASGWVREFRRAQRSLGNVTQETKSAKASLAALGATAAGILAGVVSKEAATAAYEMGRMAAQYRDAKAVFDASGASLEQFRRETSGLISDQKLVQQFNLARTLGVSEEAFRKLAAAALASARATGQSAEFLFESAITGAARQSVQILDNLGIKIRKTGDSAKFMSDLLIEADKIIAQSGDAADASSTKYGQWEVQVENLKLAMGDLTDRLITNLRRELGPELDWMGDKFAELVDNMEPIVASIGTHAASLFQAVMNVFRPFTLGVPIISQGLLDLVRVLDETDNAIRDFFGFEPKQAGIVAFLDKLNEKVKQNARDFQAFTLGMDAAIRRIANIKMPGAPSRPGGSGGGSGGGGGDGDELELNFEPGRATVIGLGGFDSLEDAIASMEDSARGFRDELDTTTIAMPELTQSVHDARRELEELEQLQMEKFAQDVGNFVDAFVQGRGFQETGQAVGSAVGGAIGSVFGGEAIGGVIGGIIGSVLGNLLDELVQVIGVLTPVFDGLAVIVKSMSPIFMVLKILTKEIGITFELIALAIAPQAELIAAVLLIFVRLLQVVLRVFQLVIIFAAGLAANLEFITAGIQALDQLALRPLVEVFGRLRNEALQLNNAFVLAIRSFLSMANLPGVDPNAFGVTVSGIEGNTGDPIGDFATTLDELREEQEEREAAERCEALRDNTSAIREFTRTVSNIPEFFRVALVESRQERPASAPLATDISGLMRRQDYAQRGTFRGRAGANPREN